jgi:saccharopine dehydrogenase-like NADP-dependent oxidoreductase
MRKRILLIGGTGVFGTRLARHLARDEGIELFISSRSQSKADKVAATISTKHPVQGVAIDHAVNLAQQLNAIKPFAVVDCSGPFQSADYTSAKAIIQSGAHLVDLADARNYLSGFSEHLNALAVRNGVTALTGASSTPALSFCVVQSLTMGWTQIDSIDIAITPGGKSEVGRAVIEAIFSYAGKPVPIWKNGKLEQATGWTKARRITVPRLGNRRVALVETLDAQFLGPLHKVKNRVTFSAGLESKLEQFGVEAIAHLRKRGLCPDPKILVPTLLKLREITRIPTSDKGGMMVEISGLDAACKPIKKTWSLLAINDQGPNIPILPAAACIKKLMTQDMLQGATLAAQRLTLDDILIQMAHWGEDIKVQTQQI